jgi:4-hydroxyacetophenone monooxygenase
MYLEAEFADAPTCWRRCCPTTRPSPSGSWTTALGPHPQARRRRADHRRIERITPTGIVTADGVEHEVDVIIYGTGFQASEFLTPMQVTGRRRGRPARAWGGDARAYLGITVPEFPNLFCSTGPNTNIVINGSIIYFSECEVHYVASAVRLLLEGLPRAMDVPPEVHDAYNERIDEATAPWRGACRR